MAPLKVLVVEDEMILAADLCRMLRQMGYEVLDPCIGYTEAVQALDEEQPELALLDIQLGGQKDGVDLAAHIRKHHDMPVIFLTSHSDRSTVDRAVSVAPNGYLVKPVDEDSLFTAIESAVANFRQGPAEAVAPTPAKSISDSIFVKVDRYFVKIKIEDILYLKSDRNYIDVVTERKTYAVRSSFTELLEGLNTDTFTRIHKSYFVNVDKIDAVNHASIQVGEHEIPMGRNYREDVYALMKRFS